MTYEVTRTGSVVRRLRIYAYDPQLGRRRRHRISIDVPAEPLLPGPRGRLLSVIDYDGMSDRYYPPVDLEDPFVALANGHEPNVGDPRFHQQMVYAVGMRVVANFERSLGRRMAFEPLTVLPHAFAGRNAFFDPGTRSVCFGYFNADPDDPGDNIPGQLVFTCLSHDVIAHEITHAIVHQLHPHFYEPSNPDVFAFHEAMGDIVAIFQHFSFPSVLRSTIRDTRGDLTESGPLIELARQFGQTTGTGSALRSVRDADTPDRSLISRAFEPHDRGSILVRAVFDAFFEAYRSRVADLVRLATGGTGILPQGHISPDLVNRLGDEAADTAQRVLDLCISGLDYLAPIDVTFGDYLRSLVTADAEINPDDPYELRANLVDSFLARGIYPHHVLSLNEESLILPEAPAADFLPRLEPDIIDPRTRKPLVARGLFIYANRNAFALGLSPSTDRMPIKVSGVNRIFRVGADGRRLSMVVQFVQTKRDDRDGSLGGLPRRAGTTVVFTADGYPYYVLSKPLPSKDLDRFALEKAEARLSATRNFVAECDAQDPYLPWADTQSNELRMFRRFSFAMLHQRARSRTRGFYG